MKNLLIPQLLVIVTGLLLFSCQGEKAGETKNLSENNISDFIGQWTIDIEGNWVGWLEVRQEDKYLDGQLLWKWGSVLPVSYMYAANDVMYVGQGIRRTARVRDAEGKEIRSHSVPNWLEVHIDGEKINGYQLVPKSDGTGVDSTSFTGTKLPDVPSAPDMSALKFGNPIALFNGKDLRGWRLVEGKSANGWLVEDGVLVNNPVQKEGEPHVNYGNLRTEQEFNEFNISLEVNVPAGSNSGVYLCGRYEIQVVDSYGKNLDSHNMGGLYSRITPSVSAEKPAGTWQTMDITLCDRHVTVILNGVKIIDNQPVYGPTGGALTSDVSAPGPIYLQGDHGKVSYRNIVLKPILK